VCDGVCEQGPGEWTGKCVTVFANRLLESGQESV